MTTSVADKLGRPVSRETAGRLEAYAALLARWNPAINMVASSTLPDIWSRHFADSAQLLDIAPPQARHWVDLGSGGGFPGMVIALLSAAERPAMSVTLVESDKRKCAFLQAVSHEAGVPVNVLAGRAEALEPLRADVLSARALAPLATLVGYAERHLAPSGTALFMKGESYEKELRQALARWTFSVEKHPSRSDPRSVILEIREPARA